MDGLVMDCAGKGGAEILNPGETVEVTTFVVGATTGTAKEVVIGGAPNDTNVCGAGVIVSVTVVVLPGSVLPVTMVLRPSLNGWRSSSRTQSS